MRIRKKNKLNLKLKRGTSHKEKTEVNLNRCIGLKKNEKIRVYINNESYFNEIGKYIYNIDEHKKYIHNGIEMIFSKLSNLEAFGKDIEFLIIPYYSPFKKEIYYHYFSPHNKNDLNKIKVIANFAKWIQDQFYRNSIYKLTNEVFSKFPERSILEIEISNGDENFSELLNFEKLKDKYPMNHDFIKTAALLLFINNKNYLAIKESYYKILIPKEEIITELILKDTPNITNEKTFNDNVYDLIDTIGQRNIDLINDNVKKYINNYNELLKIIDEKIIKAFISMTYHNSVKYIYFVPANYGSMVSAGGIILFCKNKLDKNKKDFYQEMVTKIFMNPGLKESLELSKYYSTRSAVASIMSRNMSHNIGSHILSNITIEEIAERKYDIHKLNSYLQQRMDFQARISTQWPETGEYLFFYSDLIKGFFKQSLLLDKIIKDDGVNGERIQFCLKINNSPEIWFFRNGIHYDKEKNQSNTKETNAWEFEKSQGVIPNDLLIQLPGGILGTHAFYIIIENIMRNSAKYNLKDRGYNIHIEIDQNENNDLSYKVRIFDNFSNNTNGYQLENGEGCTLVQLLQEKLQGALIKETGELTANDWGIQEIKIAAQFLNYPFEEKEIGIKAADERFKYIWIEEHELNGQKLAGYVFSIPKARLILCVDYPSKPVKQEELETATRKGVFFTELNHRIDAVSKWSPEILYDAVSKWSPEILYFEVKHNDTEKFRKVLEFLSEHRYFLPTRIVISAEKAGIERLYEIYKEFEGKLPPRRLIICPSEEIKKDDWEKFIINVYKQWVFRWHKEELMTNREKPLPVKVGIVIYFERSENEIFSRWSELKKELLDFGLDNIKMCFYSTTGHKSEISDFSKDDHSEKCDVLMGFDNHANIRKNFGKWDFYQVIGHDINLGMNNHTIFDSLTNITPGMGGMMYLLSLIESAFTKVAIVDERVANATFEENNNMQFTFTKKAVRQNNIINSGLMISASIWENELRHQLIAKDKNISDFKLFQEENGNIEGISEKSMKFYTMKDQYTADIKEQEIDILVFHLGFLEEIFKNRKEEMKTWLEKLSKKVSKIVLISGRGFKPDEIPHKLPFREASLITNHIVSDFSKLHLVKGLISARGKQNDRK